MLLTYEKCIDKFGSDYKLKKELANNRLFMKAKGIYSTSESVSETDIIMLKYPRTVFTGRSAYYYHSLSDVIPDYYYLASRREDTRIRDYRIHQSYMKDEIFEQGIIELCYNNSTIRIYNIERMLIELMRFRKKIPLDYYKEIIQNYRKKIYDMDFGLVEDYAFMFRNSQSLMDMIQLEVL